MVCMCNGSFKVDDGGMLVVCTGDAALMCCHGMGEKWVVYARQYNRRESRIMCHGIKALNVTMHFNASIIIIWDSVQQNHSSG